MLDIIYSFMEYHKAGGQTGFTDLENFQNIHVNCSHLSKTFISYEKFLAEPITAIVSFFEKLPTFDKKSAFNIPFPTLGGKVFGNNVYETEKYIFQQCITTKHYRAIDKSKLNLRVGYSKDLFILLNNIL